MVLTVVLLLVAAGLLVASLGAGQVVLAWGSVALSAVVAVRILVQWQRRRDAPGAEPVELLDAEPVDVAPVTAGHGGRPVAPAPVEAGQHEAGQHDVEPQRDVEPQSEPVRAAGQGDQVAAAGTDHEADVGQETDAGEPGEEDTDAADLLVVYELTDEVLVVDEQPRYHLRHCPWPEHARAERLPVREARELGFTPCDRCRPDKALARKHRAAGAATPGNAATPGSWAPEHR